MDWTVNKCIKCLNSFEEDEDLYTCYICKQNLHKKCANLTASEQKCMPMQKRSLRLICSVCDNFITKLPDLLSMVEGIQKDVALMKGNMSRINNEENNNSASRKYADVLKQKAEPVLVVKPISDQASNLTRSEIKQAIDPIDIGINISQLKQVSKGAVVIGCENRAEVNLLRTKISEKIGDKYNVEIPVLKKPRLKIMNIHNEDIDIEDAEIVNKIRKQNRINNERNDVHIRIVKKIENKRYRSSTLIVETDPLTHKSLLANVQVNIGWSRGSAYNHINLLQCFKCYGFNHVANDCQSELVCSLCSENHNYKECKSQEVRCTNCIRAQKNLNIVLDTNHEAVSKDCPCYLRLVNKRSQKIDCHRE